MLKTTSSSIAISKQSTLDIRCKSEFNWPSNTQEELNETKTLGCGCDI